METQLHEFLNSNLLEKYLVEATTPKESEKVTYFLSHYPEAQRAYEELQQNLEIMARYTAAETPKESLNSILDQIDSSVEEPKVIKLERKRGTPWYFVAASVAAVLFGISSFVLYEQNRTLKAENNVIVDEIFDLRSDIDKNNSKLDQLAAQLTKLNNPDAKKYVLTGNARAKNLKTVAYINPVDKTSMIDVITLPQLPKNQQYEIWAEVQDKMVNLGILDKSDRDLKPIPYVEDALALSIMIGEKNKDSIQQSTEVAEISLKNK